MDYDKTKEIYGLRGPNADRRCEAIATMPQAVMVGSVD